MHTLVHFFFLLAYTTLKAFIFFEKSWDINLGCPCHTQDQTPTEDSDEDVLIYFETEGRISSFRKIPQGYQAKEDVQVMYS